MDFFAFWVNHHRNTSGSCDGGVDLFPSKVAIREQYWSSKAAASESISRFVTIKCCLMYLCVSDLLWLNHSDTNYLHWSFIQFINVTLYWGNLGWASGPKLASETVICFKTLSFRMTSLCHLWWGLMKWHELWKMHLLVHKVWRSFQFTLWSVISNITHFQKSPV